MHISLMLLWLSYKLIVCALGVPEAHLPHSVLSEYLQRNVLPRIRFVVHSASALAQKTMLTLKRFTKIANLAIFFLV